MSERIEQAARAAAAPVRRRLRITRPTGIDELLKQPTRLRYERKHPKVLPYQAPRQMRLEIQRAATQRALAYIKPGQPVGRRTRQRIAAGIPRALHDAICADRKRRREMVFATRSHGRKAGRRPRQRSIWSEVKC